VGFLGSPVMAVLSKTAAAYLTGAVVLVKVTLSPTGIVLRVLRFV
jgi:hypothetical protein